MISWHRVGQRVVCVDAGLRINCKGVPVTASELTEQKIYTIKRVGATEGQAWFFLKEVDAPLPFCGFIADRFKPVRKTDISCFEAILRQMNDSVSA